MVVCDGLSNAVLHCPLYRKSSGTNGLRGRPRWPERALSVILPAAAAPVGWSARIQWHAALS
ncbi:hypothetical protein FHT08_000529 [Xanthomonas campestris]|nr:hypothetical protein [Xanthomonas sp. CFBP 8151]